MTHIESTFRINKTKTPNSDHSIQLLCYAAIHMKRLQSLFISTILVTGILAFWLGWFFARNVNAPKINVQTAITKGPASEVKIRDLDDAWAILQERYYDVKKLDRREMEYAAVKGFVAGINDAYTLFMTPEESKQFEEELEGELEGIGAELEVKEGKLVIVTPLKSSPAEEAGLKPGDIIYKIDGDLAENMALMSAVKRIRGKKGTTVTLTIIREATMKPFDVKIVRRAIVIDSVTMKKLDGDIFHISINQFNDHTKPEFSNAVQRILLERAKGLILDLRGNGGGYLDISVDILSEFIAGEKTGAVIKKRNGADNETVKTNGNARLPDIPLVVLVNKGSASASEIVAGAIQDYKRGVVMGEKTFGKGSVQELNKLPDGATLRLTIAEWLTPFDRGVNEIGIVPDKIVELTDEDAKANRDPQLEEAKKYLIRRGAGALLPQNK